MNYSFLSRIISLTLCLFISFSPVALHASEIDPSTKELETGEILESPKKMSQKQMNDLFGEDPYLGQTSYLQSPDGFSQRAKSK